MFETLVKIENDPVIPVDDNFLSDFRFDNGFALPPSYVRFCRELSYGRLCGQFLIYVPLVDKNYADSLLRQSRDIKLLFKDYLNPLLYAIEEVQGGEDLIRNAFPFGRSENGDFLFWDTRQPLVNGEFPIYCTGFSNGIPQSGNSLPEFIRNITGAETVNSVLPFNRQPLPATFECFTKLFYEEDKDV